MFHRVCLIEFSWSFWNLSWSQIKTIQFAAVTDIFFYIFDSWNMWNIRLLSFYSLLSPYFLLFHTLGCICILCVPPESVAWLTVLYTHTHSHLTLDILNTHADDDDGGSVSALCHRKDNSNAYYLFCWYISYVLKLNATIQFYRKILCIYLMCFINFDNHNRPIH